MLDRGIQQLIKVGARIQMWAWQLEDPWFFTTLHTVAPLAGNACVTYVCADTCTLRGFST